MPTRVDLKRGRASRQTLLYHRRLCIQCLRRCVHVFSTFYFLSPFRATLTNPSYERGNVRMSACSRGGNAKSGGGEEWIARRRSWCNCMLIECASEYGIRMEAVRFDIPFCLRSSPHRPSSTSSSSSDRLLRIRLSLRVFCLPIPCRVERREERGGALLRTSTLHENRKRSIPRLILRLLVSVSASSRSPPVAYPSTLPRSFGMPFVCIDTVRTSYR